MHENNRRGDKTIGIFARFPIKVLEERVYEITGADILTVLNQDGHLKDMSDIEVGEIIVGVKANVVIPWEQCIKEAILKTNKLNKRSG